MKAAKFNADLNRWLFIVQRRSSALFLNTAAHVQRSITDGDVLTGAPGQPVDTGYLKAHWQLILEGPLKALIATNVAYAPVIEENRRAAYARWGKQPTAEERKAFGGDRPSRKSTVGGSHSVKLTKANFDKIVAAELDAVIREVR